MLEMRCCYGVTAISLPPQKKTSFVGFVGFSLRLRRRDVPLSPLPSVLRPSSVSFVLMPPSRDQGEFVTFFSFSPRRPSSLFPRAIMIQHCNVRRRYTYIIVALASQKVYHVKSAILFFKCTETYRTGKA